MAAIPPRRALETPGLLLVDLRPLAERYGGIGFVPASVSVPWQADAERWAADVRKAAGALEPLIVCTSGHRAQSCGAPLGWHHLEGGVLGWAAERLPVCGHEVTRSPDEPVLSVEEFPRHMAACFVGELAEAALDHPDLDPLAILRRCFEREGVRFEAPTLAGLLRVLDQAALASLELGTPLARIAANLDHMLARLPDPGWSRVA